MLKIRNNKNEIIARANPSGAAQIALTNTFNETGDYLIEVSELAGNSGPALYFQVHAYPFEPGFLLTSETPFLEAESAGTAKLKITATRFEYDGPIEITLNGGGEGIHLKNNLIPAKKNDAEITLLLSDEWEPGQSVRFAFEGMGINGQKSPVSTMPALRKEWPLMLFPPPALDGWFALGVKQK
jgi:hypothetical protein